MSLSRILERLAMIRGPQGIPQGVIDEGRIFSLGLFDNSDNLHGRVVGVVEGLKDHIGQPFELHPWVFTVQLSTFKQNGDRIPLTFVEAVYPQPERVGVRQYLVLSHGLRHVGDYIYQHTPAGTKVDILRSNGREAVGGGSDMSLYPLAIAMLNTRGCRVDLKRAPAVINARRKRQGKTPIPGHYDVGAAEYITALRATSGGADRGGGHASPIPHLRRAHERELSDGRRVWVSSALINVRSEGDIAFVERRVGYRNG